MQRSSWDHSFLYFILQIFKIFYNYLKYVHNLTIVYFTIIYLHLYIMQRASRDHSFLYFVVWPLTRQVYIYNIYIYEQMKRSWVLPYESRDVGLHQSVCAHAQTHVE